MTGLVRSELRKTFSTRLWWGLLIPVLVLSLLINLFGGLITDGFESLSDGLMLPLLLASVAYSVGLTSVFAAVFGAVTAAGEFRHRTITTTYLTSRGRGPVLVAKMAVNGALGALYALAAAVVGVAGGLAGSSRGAVPDLGTLLAVVGVGVAVCALWAAAGTALATVVANQVGAIVGILVYLLLGELLLAALLNRSDTPAVARLSAFLPGNAGDIALYDIPATVIAGPGYAQAIVETVAGVTAPPPWWGALLVLLAWTLAAGATAWVAAARRDIT